MPKVFIVQNPVSGTRPGEEVTDAIRHFFRALGWEHHIHQTEKGEDVPSLVSSKTNGGYDLFIAAGGDGTVSAVATGLANREIPMGILPVGTGNGLARDLHIPLSLDEALQLISENTASKTVDAIEVNGRYHLLHVSVGITPMTAKNASREQKQRLGIVAYFLEGFRSLIGFQPITFYLEIDGIKVRVRASEVLLMNSFSMGDPDRFLNLGIDNTDGRLDLFVIKSRTAIDYLRVAWNILLRQPRVDPDVERFYVEDRLAIKTRRQRPIQADGDLIGSTPVEARLIPQAVDIIVPK